MDRRYRGSTFDSYLRASILEQEREAQKAREKEIDTKAFWRGFEFGRSQAFKEAKRLVSRAVETSDRLRAAEEDFEVLDALDFEADCKTD
jgi:hypothetical protein